MWTFRKNLSRLGIVACIAIWFFMPHPAAAQFTQVQGQVLDPSGRPYADGTITPTLIISGSPRFASSGFPYVPPTTPTGLDGQGRFVMSLADVTQLLPTGGLWSFTVCSGAGTIPPAGGAGPVCFTTVGIIISGSVQDISAVLQAAAPPLAAGGLPSASAAGQVPVSTGVGSNYVNLSPSSNGWINSVPISIGGSNYFGTAHGALSYPGKICGVTAAGSYPPVPATGYGYAVIDVCPALFTAPAPLVAGTSSRSIMGINSAIATSFPDHFNVMSINSQLTSPPTYSGNQWAWNGVYHETDWQSTGTLNASFGAQIANYNSGNGTVSTHVGLYVESANAQTGGFGGNNTNTTGTITNNYGIWVKTGTNHAGATNTGNNSIFVDTPYSAGTFTGGTVGINIADQTAGNVIANSYALRTSGGAIDFRGPQTVFNLLGAFYHYNSSGNGDVRLLEPIIGASEQILAWPTTVPSGATGGGLLALHPCGTTSSCSNSQSGTTSKILNGTVTLVSGTPSSVTVSGISPSFTSSTSFNCTCSDNTTASNACNAKPASSSSITITGVNSVSDTVSYICAGN